MTLLLTGGTLVRSLDPLVVAHDDLVIAEGRVQAQLPVRGPGNTAPDVQRLDCSGCLVLPGNVSAHTHAYSSLARGMPYRLAPPTGFLEILQRIWWRLDRALDMGAIRASALVAAHEAVLAGTTTLFDHHASPHEVDGSLDVIAEAFEEVGLRSVLCYETSDRDGPHVARAGVEENRRFLQRVRDGRWPLARGMVGAHASFTLSPETLAECVATAREEKVGLHVHVAEDAIDQADCLARFDQRVVHRLHAAGALDERSLLAHAVHLQPAEAELIRGSRATVAHNPTSNMNNGVGRTPLAWLSGRLALGTDGIGGDLFAESRTAFFRRREEELDTSALLPLQLLGRGARRAGSSFGEPMLGSLQPGAPADVTVLDYAAPAPLDETSLPGHWTFGLGAANVRDVIINGELVLRDRRSTRVDASELAMEGRRAAKLLWERMEQLGPHAFSPTRLLATAGGG